MWRFFISDGRIRLFYVVCFCIIYNLFIFILCYYVSEVILGDSLGRDTSENKGTAPGLSWGAPEKVRDMVFVWLPVLFRSNNISSPNWAYQENQSASIYGKGLWRDPTVCGLNCKIFSCQDYLFTLPLPQKRLSLKKEILFVCPVSQSPFPNIANICLLFSFWKSRLLDIHPVVWLVCWRHH